MSSYAAALVSALIVVTLWFMSAAFLSARQGRTWRAILYLLVASLPFGVAAMRADLQKHNVSPGQQRRAVDGRNMERAPVAHGDAASR